MMMSTVHIPILVEPIVKNLIEPFVHLPPQSEPHWLVDCTLGGGGHCEAFLKAFSERPETKKHRILAFDQDPTAVKNAHVRFQKEISEGRLEIVCRRFGESADLIQNRPVLGLMADLGFSSDQLEDENRGISFQSKGPLDMRLDPTRGQSCKDLLREISENDLEEILRELGEERFSRRIASAVVRNRSEGRPPSTTQDLVDIVVRAVPAHARHGRIHVATRTFQALRIAVNEELSELDHLLNDVIIHLRPEGRIAILSFHSLEDRKVKMRLKNGEDFSSLTKKPIQAADDEVRSNPRARSAKLRIAQRVES